MAKQSGLGDALWVDGVDLSGDVGALGAIAGGTEPLGVTGINRSAFERLGGKLDGRIEFTSFFNDAAGPPAQEHQTLKTRPLTDRIVTYVRGPALGAQAATLEGKQINYDGTRGDDGSLTFDVEAQANGQGLVWAALATAGKRTDGAATNGAGIDNGAATTFGLKAWAHLFAFTGTSVTFQIQESSDNGAGDPYAVAGTGFAVTGPFTAPGAGGFLVNASSFVPFNVERWLRVSTVGTFSNAVFAVAIERFATASTPV